MYRNFPLVINIVLVIRLTYTGTKVHLFRFSSVRGKYWLFVTSCSSTAYSFLAYLSPHMTLEMFKLNWPRARRSLR
jgi:hypothetical protein